MNEWYLLEEANMRRQEIDREIEKIQLIKEANKSKAVKPFDWGPAVYALGELLIAWGNKLKKRADRETMPTDACY